MWNRALITNLKFNLNGTENKYAGLEEISFPKSRTTQWQQETR
jgi:hypothetical protein